MNRYINLPARSMISELSVRIDSTLSSSSSSPLPLDIENGFLRVDKMATPVSHALPLPLSARRSQKQATFNSCTPKTLTLEKEVTSQRRSSRGGNNATFSLNNFSAFCHTGAWDRSGSCRRLGSRASLKASEASRGRREGRWSIVCGVV